MYRNVVITSIITVILITSGLSFVEANEQISDSVLSERSWLKTVDDNKKHIDFVSYVTYDIPDNGWNKVMLKENIRNYNIETKIGHNIDGYEIVALVTQKEIMSGKYNPSKAQAKLHQWISTQSYNVPQSISEIDDRLEDIVGKNHIGLVKQLVMSINKMTDFGNVGEEIHSKAPEFWNKVGNLALCDFIPDCGQKMFDGIQDSENKITFVTTYGNHIATIYITYDKCTATIQTCDVFDYNSGTGIITQEIPSPDTHIQDYWIYVSMTNYGTDYDNVWIESQVTESLLGGTVAGFDNDGYVTKTGNLYNPNASSESAPTIEFRSKSYL